MRLRIVFAGMLAGVPYQGGAVWATLQWVLGLRALGHEVLLVEPVTAAQLQPLGTSLAASANAAYFMGVLRRFGLEDCAALVAEGTTETVGLDHDRVIAFARSADVVLNASGQLTDTAVLGPVARRVWLDLDPAFNQLWHEVEGIDMHLDGHTHFVTVGLAVGSDGCAVPLCGRQWATTLPPVALEYWPASPGDAAAPLTTVARWRAYGPIEHEGVRYGQKVHALRPLLGLPRRTGAPFSIALDIHPDEEHDLSALAEGGWDVVDPATVVPDADGYQRFIQASGAEFGIAKEGYVASRCGWFSDRSACYLATGRPVLAHDTGFADYLPTGAGLLAFADEDSAADAVDAVRSAYDSHAAAARDLAEAYFDSRSVLTAVLEHAGAAA